jgi:hypothetical protein
MRRDAAGPEPISAPQPLAERRELAEMRRSLDGAALEAELLRRGIVMNRRVGIVDLRIEHLARLSPRTNQRTRGVVNDRLECG